ncbi:MAG: hypothetical protein E7161_04685, partial [Firmicutes bacterium]|nr:hypothetical protein [Bacillota bacterium]
MTELIEFKKEVKAAQAENRLFLKKIEQEAKEIRSRITKITTLSNDTFSFMYPALHMVICKLPEFAHYFEDNINGSPLIKVDLDKHIDMVIKMVRHVYNSNQVIINAIENDKIINYVDLERLLMILTRSKLPHSQSLKIFGMVVAFDKKYIEKHGCSNQKNDWIVELLSEFFSSDGTLVMNTDVEHFKGLLSALLVEYEKHYKYYDQKYIIRVGVLEEIQKESSSLVNAWTHLLMVNNARLEMESTHQDSKEDIEELDTPKENISREGMEELRKYYKNGELIEVPEDIEVFKKILDKCGIDENDKRYILGLVTEALEKQKSTKILKYLNANDKKTYQEAEELLKGI